MSLAASHDFFPGLTAHQRVTVLRRILGDESIPQVVATFLRSLEGSEPLPIVRPNLAETPDSVLGATVTLRSAAGGGPAAGGFALTQGPPWAAWLPIKPDHLVSVDADGAVVDLEEIPTNGGLHAALLSFTVAERSRTAAQSRSQDVSATEGPAPTGIFEKLQRQLKRPWSKLVEALLIDNQTAPDLVLDPGGALLPLAVVDEHSVAAVVCKASTATMAPIGGVVRWFLTDVDDAYQGALLDTDAQSYLESLHDELKARAPGLDRILDEIGPAYQDAYIANEKRPRDFVVRPVRIACQNVIVALGAIAQDSTFDGLSVVAWQTCEVPHVGTHEANRALAALTLCDAFQNGGTMEIRFDRSAQLTVSGKTKVFKGHPEGGVPASLRRYGRTVGITLGAEDPAAITPTEARDLFLAITPMTQGLREKVGEAIASGILPERICFTLLSSGGWSEIELEFILASSHRAESILAGGAEWEQRGARQAEAEVCRSAVMVGMLYRRMNSRDVATSDGEVRVIEDRSRGVTWEVEGTKAGVTFSNLDPEEPVAWTHGLRAPSLCVIPCSDVNDGVREAIVSWQDVPMAVLVPRDVYPSEVPTGTAILRCPDRLADLDKAVEAKLLTSRISRG